MRALLVVTGLLAVLGLAWLSAASAATAPGPSGPSLAQELTPEPAMTATTTDEGVYLTYVRRLQSGQAYYPMVARTLTQGNAVRVGGRVDRSRPTSFRLPTLYALLAALPPYGISLVLAMMALGSAAAVAAFALASRFAPPALALLGALAVAVFYYGEATRYALLGTEPWAGGLILVAASLAVWAPETRTPLLAHCAAAAAALAAASLRELAAPFVLLGLAASLRPAEDRRGGARGCRGPRPRSSSARDTRRIGVRPPPSSAIWDCTTRRRPTLGSIPPPKAWPPHSPASAG